MKKIVLAALIVLPSSASLAVADDPVLPPNPPPPSQYESLWTKSPFAVATPEAVADSPDYSLVGVTQLDGVAYASIVQKQNSDHFLISSETENKGMVLKSITRSKEGDDTFATVQKDGQILTLRLEKAPAGPVAAGPGVPGNAPPMVQNLQMPGAGLSPAVPGGPTNMAGSNPNSRFFRIHRPTIHLPPMPGQPGGAPNGQPNQPTGTPVTPESVAPGGNGQPSQQPVQPHFTPPSQ